MSYYLYLKKQKAEELLSTSDGFIHVCEGKHSDNIYLTTCVEKLKELNQKLGRSISYHKQKGIIAISNAADLVFNACYTDWRTMLETQASVESLPTSDSCAKVSEILNRINRNLHLEPKDVQISLFERFIAETSRGERTLHTNTGIEALFNEAVAAHTELKEIENRRGEAGINTIETPSEISLAIRPIMTLLYEHLEGYSFLGEAAYVETLADLREQLSPVVTRIKTRITREKNEAVAAE